MPKAEKPRPGRRWKQISQPPSDGLEVVAPAALSKALAAGQLEFTQAELDGFGVELEWKSFVRGADSIYFQPKRPPRRDPPALIVAFGTFVLITTYGFFWMLWTMGSRSYGFFAEVDIASPGGALVAVGGAALAATTLYYVLYPEGQLARDADADRGAGRVTKRE